MPHQCKKWGKLTHFILHYILFQFWMRASGMSNVAKNVNNWIGKATRELPLLLIIYNISLRIIKRFYARNAESSVCMETEGKEIMYNLRRELRLICAADRRLAVHQTCDFKFLAISNFCYLIELFESIFSCKHWTYLYYLFFHALAAIQHANSNFLIYLPH